VCNLKLFLMWNSGSIYDVPMDELCREYLTGFRKRKQQRTEEKKARWEERKKQERLEERRQVSMVVSSLKNEVHTWSHPARIDKCSRNELPGTPHRWRPLTAATLRMGEVHRARIPKKT